MARPKLAFMRRNKFPAGTIPWFCIGIDQEDVIAAGQKRDMATAVSLMPDEALEAGTVPGSQDKTSILPDTDEAQASAASTAGERRHAVTQTCVPPTRPRMDMPISRG